MAAGSVLNGIRVVLTSATGGALTLGAKIQGFNAPGDAWSGAVDGTIYEWVIENNFDGSGVAQSREGGYGVYTASGGTLARNTIWSTSTSNAQITITGTSHVIITPLAASISDLLAMGSFSAVTTLDFVLSSYVGYRGFRFNISNVYIASGAADVLIRTSTDGGSNYDSAASDYAYTCPYIYNSLGFSSSLAASSMLMSGWLGNANRLRLDFSMMHYTLAEVGTSFMGLFESGTSGTAQYIGFFSAARLTAADVDAVRFACSASTMSGYYALYGIK